MSRLSTKTTPSGGVAAGYYRIKGLSTRKGAARLQLNRFDNRDFPTILSNKACVLWGRTAFEFGVSVEVRFVVILDDYLHLPDQTLNWHVESTVTNSHGQQGKPMKKSALPQPTKRRLPPIAASSPGFRPVIGQAVQVMGGQLAGMRGVVVEIGTPQRSVVQLNGVAAGVLLSIDNKWLCKAPRQRS